MKLKLHSKDGAALGEVEVKFPVIESAKGSQAVHDFVVAYRAAQRSGTACTKNVGEVAGTNKKPWRQKGTGRARAGSFQSPLWRGGGVVFGPKPRDFGKKLNRKARDLAFQKALSSRLEDGDVVVVEDLKLPAAKTKEFLKVMDALKLDGTTLVVTGADDRTLTLASRNVPNVETVTAANVNTYQLLQFDKVLMTKKALESVGSRIQ